MLAPAAGAGGANLIARQSPAQPPPSFYPEEKGKSTMARKESRQVGSLGRSLEKVH